MEASMLRWTLVLLSLAAPVASELQYLLAFPAVIHHTSTEKFCVLLQSVPETVNLFVILEMKNQNHTLFAKVVEAPGTYECSSFQVPAFTPKLKRRVDEVDKEVANVYIQIQKGDSGSLEGRKKVMVEGPSVRTIIDTDKPFYKPGERVKFRVLSLLDSFKAIDTVVPLIFVTDPNKNRIAQWQNVKPNTGIVDLSFPLASEAALGTYIIQVERGGSSKSTRDVTVEEYELPKYEVLFKVPDLVTTSDKEIQVQLHGRYTYGKLVKGKVNLDVFRDVSFYFGLVRNTELSAIHKQYTGKTDETGYASFTLNAEDFQLSQTGYFNYLRLSAQLEEEGTGVTVSEEGRIFIVTRSAEVNFIGLNPFYKHGFPFTGKVKYTINNIPLQNQTVYLTVDVNNVESNFPYITDENGEVHFSLQTTEWNNSLVALRARFTLLKATPGNIFDLERVQNEAFRWVKPFYSESNSFLEIQQVEEELPCGKDQEVLVDYIIDRKELDPEADHVDFNYLVVSKGKIVSSGQKQVPISKAEPLKGTFSLTVSISPDLAPTARLLIYAVFLDGEVAADVDVFTIEKCFRHKVTLGFSEEEELPGSKVNLDIKADPGALCSVHAVDKSVILKENRTLTPSYVYRTHPDFGMVGSRGFDYLLEDFEPYPCLSSVGHRQKRYIVAPWFYNEADVYSLFKQLNLKVLTNTKMKKPVSCVLPNFERRTMRLHGPALAVPQVTSAQGIPQYTPEKKVEKSKPRAYFPETWIWDLVHINEEGKAIYPVTVPDTITEWHASAFCVADVGFGLSHPTTLRVFQPFFVDLTFPSSVVRGEGFQLKATVFNYLKDCIQVQATLEESQELDVKPCPTCHFTTCLCAEEAKTFSWNMTAIQLGRANISVTAEAQETHELCGNKISVTPARGRSDTVIKTLLVKPEGVLEEEAHNLFLCSSGDPVLDDISLKLPENVVKDSGRATISAIGDIMGAALQNVGDLLEMPYGCGEQNMVKFVPNIYVLDYLEKTNQATPEIKEKAKEFMRSGYQRQLLYKHDDGSYSAFGKRDAEGNSWLTAFVVKAFGRAKSSIYVDEKHIQDAVRWLGQHQLPSGGFQMVGKLFNNALKGGVSDEISLTAYVLISLLELEGKRNDAITENALLYLKNNLNSVHDAYPKALLAYAFTLAGDTEIRQQLLEDLDKLADKAGGDISFPEIETTAYFLLAYLSVPVVSPDDLVYASRIVRSLTKRQNPYGGFFSTQDTVVALQALPKYAALTYRETEDLKVLVKSDSGFQHEFHVREKNRLVLQQATLPEVPGQYKVEVSGNGCVYVQGTLRYNHPPVKTDALALSVETFPKECDQTSRKRFDVLLEVSFRGNRTQSNMVLIESNLVSGYIPVKTSVKQLENKPLVKKVEIEPDKISIYVDHLNSTVQSYSFSVEQELEVTDLKPATVKVYDYYHLDDFAVAEYNAPCASETGSEDNQ